MRYIAVTLSSLAKCPVALVAIEDRAPVDDAGAVEQDVDRPDLTGQRGDRRRVRQIGLVRVAAGETAERRDVDVDRMDRRALRREQLRRSAADALAPPR